LNTVDEHSIHSPFFFDFYQRVILDRTPAPGTDKIEEIRNRLLKNEMEVDYQDLGSSSKHFTSQKRKLSDIAATSLMPTKWAQLLYRIALFSEATKIVELGTSMGLTSLYLSRIQKAKVFTFEGNPAMINVALTHFEFFGVKNIQLIEGNIDTTLSDHLQNPSKIHFAFVDANHRYQPTLTYFDLLAKRMADKGIMVIDDIHGSPEMEKAWSELRQHELVYGSVDLFRMGILFFDLSLNKPHYIWTL
jgi:predicted O-methyltransferase YrrM